MSDNDLAAWPSKPAADAWAGLSGWRMAISKANAGCCCCCCCCCKLLLLLVAVAAVGCCCCCALRCNGKADGASLAWPGWAGWAGCWRCLLAALAWRWPSGWASGRLAGVSATSGACQARAWHCLLSGAVQSTAWRQSRRLLPGLALVAWPGAGLAPGNVGCCCCCCLAVGGGSWPGWAMSGLACWLGADLACCCLAPGAALACCAWRLIGDAGWRRWVWRAAMSMKRLSGGARAVPGLRWRWPLACAVDDWLPPGRRTTGRWRWLAGLAALALAGWLGWLAGKPGQRLAGWASSAWQASAGGWLAWLACWRGGLTTSCQRLTMNDLA